MWLISPPSSSDQIPLLRGDDFVILAEPEQAEMCSMAVADTSGSPMISRNRNRRTLAAKSLQFMPRRVASFPLPLPRLSANCRYKQWDAVNNASPNYIYVKMASTSLSAIRSFRCMNPIALQLSALIMYGVPPHCCWPPEAQPALYYGSYGMLAARVELLLTAQVNLYRSPHQFWASITG